jgi:transcription antitermination factor NusG
MREDGFVRIDAGFQQGDQVLINSDPFHSLTGMFDRKVKSQDRVRILLENLSCEAHITIEREAITKI